MTSEEVAGGGILCIVNLTYLSAEFLAVHGRLLVEAGAVQGDS